MATVYADFFFPNAPSANNATSTNSNNGNALAKELEEKEPSGVTTVVFGTLVAFNSLVVTDVAEAISCDKAVPPLDVDAATATGLDCDVVDVQSPKVQLGSAQGTAFWF